MSQLKKEPLSHNRNRRYQSRVGQFSKLKFYQHIIYHMTPSSTPRPFSFKILLTWLKPFARLRCLTACFHFTLKYHNNTAIIRWNSKDFLTGLSPQRILTTPLALDACVVLVAVMPVFMRHRCGAGVYVAGRDTLQYTQYSKLSCFHKYQCEVASFWQCWEERSFFTF